MGVDMETETKRPSRVGRCEKRPEPKADRDGWIDDFMKRLINALDRIAGKK